MLRVRQLSYNLCRWLINRMARPKLAGGENTEADSTVSELPLPDTSNTIYVIGNRSLSDLIILDLICSKHDLASPLAEITLGDHVESRRFFFLNRASAGWFRRNTMRTYSERMVRVLECASLAPDTRLLPVAIFWGRAPGREGTLFSSLFSENWAVSSRLKRLVNLFFSRNHIVVGFGAPVVLGDLARLDSGLIVRRAARLLRVHLRNQRVAAIGPDLSHQRTLVNQILGSRPVQQAIQSNDGNTLKAERRARKAALSIVSNMSMPTIRILEKVLTWFWHRIYNGLTVHGLHRVQQIAETHTIVYVPSHRSHVDYLLLSYVLFQHGLMVPHIAAGDNLNLPILGSILRRGGAFFMRRQFANDPLYATVFSEYLYQMYRRGHSVEFFPEGGRSRTGRLLPARLGMLKMTLDHHQRGIPRSLALVPVYFGYEKLIESGSYLDELRGGKKKRESIGDLARSLRLVRQDFGKVQINFGEPLVLDEWLVTAGSKNTSAELGREILIRINQAAAINPINLIALATLSTPRSAINESLLIGLIDCYLKLLKLDQSHQHYTLTNLSGREVIDYAEKLGMLTREHHDFGDVLCHDPVNAVLMTWYRNNVVHTLALPSLIAALVRWRRRPLNKVAMNRMVSTVFPYIAEEQNFRVHEDATNRWLQHLVRAGLLDLHAAGGYIPPAVDSPEHHQLRLLANVIMPTLERLYIVIALLAHRETATQTRKSLQEQGSRLAHKMSRIYGLNAPEFFDARLFNQCVDKLIRDRIITEDTDGHLCQSGVITDVLKAAESVIDPEFRYAIMSER